MYIGLGFHKYTLEEALVENFLFSDKYASKATSKVELKKHSCGPDI